MTLLQSQPPTEPYDLFVCAGDPSGDAMGAALAAELQKTARVRLWGVGAAHMREAGVALAYDSTEWSAIGLTAALRRVPILNVRCVQLRALVCRRRPHLVVLIDFGGFNVRLARAIKRHHPQQPILYYFPPASWSRGQRDLSHVVRVCDYIVTPFPWSAPAYAAYGAKVRWVGHPLVDVRATAPARQVVRERLNIPGDATVVGVAPGSRRSEIDLILPHALEGIHLAFQGRATPCIIVSRAATLPVGFIQRHLAKSAWPQAAVVEGVTEVFSAADLAVVTMGTATLEGCIQGCPMVTIYRGTALGYAQFGLFRPKVTFLAMPNLIAQRRIVPEITPWRQPARTIAAEVSVLIEQPEMLAAMQSDLQAAAQQLGPPGASARAARAVLDAARGTWDQSTAGVPSEGEQLRAGVP